jgi:hypothetical protein
MIPCFTRAKNKTLKNTAMIRTTFLILSLAVFQTLSSDLRAQGLTYELKQLSRIDLLPKYIIDGTVEQFSSYDRTGGNDDGFEGTHSFISMEGRDQVIAEMTGPGVINRIWTPTPTADTISFYFDGNSEPGLSLPFNELFDGSRFPFLEPVCGHEVGGYYCYLPILYNKSCKVVFKGKMLFYQIQYRNYHQKSQVKTYSDDWTAEEKEDLQQAVAIWKGYGDNFLAKMYDQIQMETKVFHILPGQSMPLFNMSKGGRIVGIEVDGLTMIDRNDNRLVMKIRWDDEADYAVEAPLKDLLGFFFGKPAMRSLLAGTSGNRSYLYFPMPFSKAAAINIDYLDDETASGKSVDLTFRIYYTDESKNKDEGKFYVRWNRIVAPPEGTPYPIIKDYKGKGHLVGTILACQGLTPGSTNYFEGDDQAIIDGKLCIHGTGSEDYFNGGWYLIPDRWDMGHSLPSHGCLGYNIALSQTGGFRHYFSDKLNFRNDFSLTIEYGPVGNKFPVDYRSVAFFYGEHPDPGLTPSVNLTLYPSPPAIRYQGYLLNILSFRNGSLFNGDRVGRNRVLTMQPTIGAEPMLIKIELEAPEDGDYIVYASWYQNNMKGEVRFMQRQVAMSEWKPIPFGEKDYVQREPIGILRIREGSGTITIHLKADAESRFMLHELILEQTSVR